MPVYQYETASGKVIEDVRSVEDRDLPYIYKGEALTRRTVPSRIFVPMGAPNPVSIESQAKKGYRNLELKQKLRQHGAHYRAKTINETWK